jgi:isocitrate dehydrogenase
MKSVSYSNNAKLNLPKYKRKSPRKKDLVGVDLFVNWTGSDPNELALEMKQLESAEVQVSMITNRGIKVWPDGFNETFCTDHWRCRFKAQTENFISKEQIIQLLQLANSKGIDVIKTENLYNFDGKASYSLGQGQ